MNRIATKSLTALLLLTVVALLVTAGARAQETIDFEEFSEGEIVSTVDVNGFSVAIEGVNSECAAGTNAAIIFDSSCPGGCSGSDPDLGTPNEDFGGPGVGTGGEAGSLFQNDTALGNLLIIHEHCNEITDPVSDPDDETGSTVLTVTFEAPVTFSSYTIVDQEANEDENVEFFADDAMTMSLGTATTPTVGDNGVAVVSASFGGVKKIVFNRSGSRGLDNLVFFPPPPGDGCTFTQGGYKNLRQHADRWPASIDPNDPFPFNPSQSYIEVLNTPPAGGDAWYILAHQYIAAKNNVLNGADPTDIAGLLADAEALLAVGPGNVPDSEKDAYTDLADILADFNEGIIGPGHCDDLETDDLNSAESAGNGRRGKATAETGAFDLTAIEASVYPNPLTTNATIRFGLPEGMSIHLALYDVMGRRVRDLASGDFAPGVHEVAFDARGLSTGVYFYRLSTPQGVQTGSMQVLR